MEQIVAIVGIAVISFGAGYLLAEFNEFRRRMKEFARD
jgi:general stress protein CsbA